MNIVRLEQKDSMQWNTFVVTHFPPVGAFLQSFEWGDFKEALHGKVLRFAIEDAAHVWLGCFQLEIHNLPLGLSYGYVPRGPVLEKKLWDDREKVKEIFTKISEFFAQEYSQLIFVRFEPPHKELLPCYDTKPYVHPTQYLQPRFNQLITIDEPEKMLTTFSSDIKHDIRAAERLGVVITHTTDPTPAELASFEAMKNDTRARSGKDIFPQENYFKHFLEIFHEEDLTLTTHAKPRLCFFIASNKEGQPVAINLNLLFGTTLTYLYGASYTGSISKRAPAYLHWKTMDYAREHGFAYYDLGGVDDDLWHGLTYFKRQFGGETLEYVGTVDAVQHSLLYKLYVRGREIVKK